MDKLRTIRDELGSIQRSLEEAEALRLWSPASGLDRSWCALEDLISFWRRVVLGTHRKRQLEELVPAMVELGFPRDDGPVRLLLEECAHLEPALEELEQRLSRPVGGGEVLQEVLEDVLRKIRLCTDVESDILFLIADQLAFQPLPAVPGVARMPRSGVRERTRETPCTTP